MRRGTTYSADSRIESRPWWGWWDGESRRSRLVGVSSPRNKLSMTLHLATTRRLGAVLIAVMTATAALVTTGTAAHAAIVPTVPLGTSAN